MTRLYEMLQNEDVKMNGITAWLKKQGFQKYYGPEGYTLVLKIHVLHVLIWEENVKHFSLGLINERAKKGPAGIYKHFTIVMIPKPINSISDAINVIGGITNMEIK